MSRQEMWATRNLNWRLRPSCPNSSVLHPFALPGGSTYTSIGATEAAAAKPCNLCALLFLSAWIWIWKGTISFTVKDRHFNDIWQSFDLLGFRGRGEKNPLNISYAMLILVILPAEAVYLAPLRREAHGFLAVRRLQMPASLLNNKIAVLKYLDFDSH